MSHIYDTIIIGGGPAGYTAALYASRAGLNIILLEKMSAGGQMTLTGDIDNYPGYENGIDGFTLGMKMQQGAERFGTKTKYAEVIDIDFSDKIKQVRTSKEVILAKTVILAVGANPRELGVKREKELIGNGVHYCAHCDGRFYKGKTVAVVGGGNSAITDALYLAGLAKKVYLIHRRDSFRAEKIYTDALLKCENVELVLNSTVTELLSDEGFSGIKVKNNDTLKEIACDGVFVSVGRKPSTDFLAKYINLDKQGYIIADETTKTNIDGVFAIGDARTKPLRQIVTAASDGAVAAHYVEEYISVNYNI